jgi:regulator of PEP synthase PpsR (kinase-PPPase family)
MHPTSKDDPHPIYILSGGVGASGEQIVHTVLAQFPKSHVLVKTITNVRLESQIEEAVAHAEAVGATLVHTLVDARLRATLISLAASQGVVEIDLMGPLLDHLTHVLVQEPLGQPGLYRKLNKAYFDRVGAIEFTIAHDDGQNAETLSQAEIVLVGVSRVGKTPVSLYLSVLGWKVANVPLVEGLEISPVLFQLGRNRVFGLTVEPSQLAIFRQQRQRRLGVPGPSSYTDPEKIFEELQYAEKVCRSAGFTILDVTDKPIETTADDLIRLVTSIR